MAMSLSRRPNYGKALTSRWCASTGHPRQALNCPPVIRWFWRVPSGRSVQNEARSPVMRSRTHWRSLQQRSARSIRCRADGGMLVIDGSLSMEGYVRPILATLLPTCRILKKMKSLRNRWMSLPELPPRLRTCLEPLRQVDTLGVIFLEHPTRIVSKLVHA